MAQPPVFLVSQEFQKLRERLPAKKRKAAAQVAKKSNGGVGDGLHGQQEEWIVPAVVRCVLQK